MHDHAAAGIAGAAPQASGEEFMVEDPILQRIRRLLAATEATGNVAMEVTALDRLLPKLKRRRAAALRDELEKLGPL